MQRLAFNHARGHAPGPATLLLGIGLLVSLGLLAGVYYQLAGNNADLQRQLQTRQAAVTPGNLQSGQSIASRQVDAAEIAEAQSHIQTPWLPLLNSLEQAQQPQLYWIQLAPDAKRKHIRMTVLAPHRQQGWALVERLKRQSALSEVKLNASESTEVNGFMMTTLHLEAAWKF